VTAILSKCGKYRYYLERNFVPNVKKRVIFVMLNPSTADGILDDATIRRCIGFAKAWGYDGLGVVNLYAYRSTDPKALKNVIDPIGPDNTATILNVLTHNKDFVCAWGANASRARSEGVLSILRVGKANIYVLGLTKEGKPRHPLFMPASAERCRWTQIEERIRNQFRNRNYD
jgi:hypothetical protein